jgi:hypothetical protein
MRHRLQRSALFSPPDLQGAKLPSPTRPLYPLSHGHGTGLLRVLRGHALFRFPLLTVPNPRRVAEAPLAMPQPCPFQPPALPVSRAQRRTMPSHSLVAYLGAADNVPRLLPSRLRSVNQPVNRSGNRFSTHHFPRLPCICAHVSHSILILNRLPLLDRLRLRPRGHAIKQYLFQRPDVVGQSGRHRRGTRPPQLR